MTVRIKKQTDTDSLIEQVEKRANVSLDKCFQCKKCSIGCPVTSHVKSAPAEIIRRLQLGADEQILKTDLIWNCLSCETCYARCPNEINFPAVIDALRSLSVEKGITPPKGNAPLFNRLFLDTVKNYGRSYDLQTLGLHKLKTHNLKQDMDKLPAMLGKCKIAILPPTGANKNLTKRIFKHTKQ
jgi:heterodisulfide reductase subunit C2